MDQIEKKVRHIAEADHFARMLGVQIIEVRLGYARCSLAVEAKHLNSAGITHGGAVFSLADMAFALASNSHDKMALALNMNINFLKATTAGAVLIAVATEDKLTNHTGLYRITVEDESGDIVGVAQGLAYRKD